MADRIDYTTYVEDAEEDSGSSVEGIASTRIYARSEVPTTPYKERPNTGKSRGADKRSSNRKSDSSNTQTDSDDTPRSSKRERDPRREYEREQREREQRDKDRRRKERKQKEAAEQMQRKTREARVEAKAPKEREVKPSKKTRPTSLTQSRTEPVVQQYRRGHVEDPSCYGVPQPATSGMRPRAQTRPNSYYPGQGPPPSMGGPAGWHPAHAGQQQQPVGYPGGSYPPPPPLYGGGPSPSMIGIPASPARHTPGFFDMTMQNQTSHLKNRFERPASAIGFRQQQHAQAPAPAGYGYDPRAYEEEPDPRITRRASRSKKQTEDDRKRMPPPEFIPRPQSALPVGSPYRPPAHKPPTRQKSRPPTTRRGVGFADQRSVGFEEDDLLGNDDNYTEVSPEANNYDRRMALARTRRGSVAYEQPGLEIMPSRTRRDSFYGDRALGGGGVSLDEDKYLTALAYQDDVNGGTPLALTAEALRKASHRAGGGSSRSTRSSDSRDESEYKRSNTTGITRSSSSDNDNVTIKVSGSAVVRVQGAEIECGDGGEITFSAPSGSRIGSGSDRASTVYQIEDGRSRVERKTLTHRIRAPSQSDSQTRSYASYAPYDPTFALDDY
ncbi:hypothetical protein EDB81DRAFT_647356 [Dactylonectria macrodidyma]|uniref:Uncharacterized protein n=1 Tax=Dactylonectria macrodidyma TaxID=307937 RepID=A0A9P9F4X0_9HYPO|nr:hypothetical protein EDB81DRAFT_647356 [Dactylonectria macrodidyma]